MANYAEAVMSSHSAARGKKAKKELDHITIKNAENGGHVISHHFSHDGGPYHEPEEHVFGKGEGKAMMAHVAKHAGVKMNDGDGDED